MLQFILERYNYWIVIILMMTGLYIVFSRGNLVKKIIGLNIFQTSVFIFYITIGKVAGGTAPILPADHDKGGHDEGGHDGEEYGEEGHSEEGHSEEGHSEGSISEAGGHETDAHETGAHETNAHETGGHSSPPTTSESHTANDANAFNLEGKLDNSLHDKVANVSNNVSNSDIKDALIDLKTIKVPDSAILQDPSLNDESLHVVGSNLSGKISNDELTQITKNVDKDGLSEGSNAAHGLAIELENGTKALASELASKTDPLHTGGHTGGHTGEQTSGVHESSLSAGHQTGETVGELIYSNPLPHVLILTAIVVGVATTAVGLALAVRIREAYGTLEEDELEAADDIAEFGQKGSYEGAEDLAKEAKAANKISTHKPQAGTSQTGTPQSGSIS